MHEQQLQELRREKWRLNGQPIRTLEDAREFIESVGFCLLYPQRPAGAGADLRRRVRGQRREAADARRWPLPIPARARPRS